MVSSFVGSCNFYCSVSLPSSVLLASHKSLPKRWGGIANSCSAGFYLINQGLGLLSLDHPFAEQAFRPDTSLPRPWHDPRSETSIRLCPTQEKATRFWIRILLETKDRSQTTSALPLRVCGRLVDLLPSLRFFSCMFPWEYCTLNLSVNVLSSKP